MSLPTFGYGLPAYYVLALSEASSNLSRYDGVRYGARAANAADLPSLFGNSRRDGLGAEVSHKTQELPGDHWLLGRGPCPSSQSGACGRRCRLPGEAGRSGGHN